MSARVLSQIEVDAATSLLVRAFTPDPGFRFIVPDNDQWARAAADFFRRVVARADKQGLCLVDSTLNAVSVWEPPAVATSSPLKALFELFQLGWILRGNLGRALSIQRRMQGYRPQRPHWYLAYIATDPDTRRRGLGSIVMRPMLEHADQAQLPIYLECSNISNIPFYTSHGFTLIAEVSITTSHAYWPMIREPQT